MSAIGNYPFNDSFCTGTSEQLNEITIFAKKQDFLEYRILYPAANWIGYIPYIGVFSGVPRIISAALSIFKEVGQMRWSKDDPHAQECWNAFKNLSRGVVECLPFWNLTLMIHDLFRGIFHFHKQIKISVKDENEIAGIALDGKVVFTAELEKVRKIKLAAKDPKEPKQILTEKDCADALYDSLKMNLITIEKLSQEKNRAISLNEYLTDIFPSVFAELTSN